MWWYSVLVRLAQNEYIQICMKSHWLEWTSHFTCFQRSNSWTQRIIFVVKTVSFRYFSFALNLVNLLFHRKIPKSFDFRFFFSISWWYVYIHNTTIIGDGKKKPFDWRGWKEIEWCGRVNGKKRVRKQSQAEGTFGIYSFICVRMCNFLFLCALYFMFAVFPVYIFVAVNVAGLYVRLLFSVCHLFLLLYITVPQFFGYYCFFALLRRFFSFA